MSRPGAITFPQPQRGAAALEFALLLVPLLMLLGGAVEFGRAIYTYDTLVKAARDAARLASGTSAWDPDYGTVKAHAACLAAYGTTDCSGDPLVPGLTAAMVSICDPVSCPATHHQYAAGTTTVNLDSVTIGSAASPVVLQAVSTLMPALFGMTSIPLAPVSATLPQVS
jgi:Flp pilus assembly protein TadG